jgi:hypothetical protein
MGRESAEALAKADGWSGSIAFTPHPDAAQSASSDLPTRGRYES